MTGKGVCPTIMTSIQDNDNVSFICVILYNIVYEENGTYHW